MRRPALTRISVTITDPDSNSRHGQPHRPGRLCAARGDRRSGHQRRLYGTSITNQTVATFTDPGLVANLAALGISDPTTQFSASINWGDTIPEPREPSPTTPAPKYSA